MGNSLQDIRNDIDDIDFKILLLLKKRQNLVLSAAKFKDCAEGKTGVIVPSRIKSMLNDRLREAERLGLDKNFVEKIYRSIIDHMIGLEMERWKENDSSASK